jgi:hypothetical protein
MCIDRCLDQVARGVPEEEPRAKKLYLHLTSDSYGLSAQNPKSLAALYTVYEPIQARGFHRQKRYNPELFQIV